MSDLSGKRERARRTLEKLVGKYQPPRLEMLDCPLCSDETPADALLFNGDVVSAIHLDDIGSSSLLTMVAIMIRDIHPTKHQMALDMVLSDALVPYSSFKDLPLILEPTTPEPLGRCEYVALGQGGCGAPATRLFLKVTGQVEAYCASHRPGFRPIARLKLEDIASSKLSLAKMKVGTKMLASEFLALTDP